MTGPTEETFQRMRAQIAAHTRGSASRPPHRRNPFELRRRVWIPAVAALLTTAVVAVAAVVTRDSSPTTSAGGGDVSAILTEAAEAMESQASGTVQVPQTEQWFYRKEEKYEFRIGQRPTLEVWTSVDFQRHATANDSGDFEVSSDAPVPEPDPIPTDYLRLYELFAGLPDDTAGVVETIYDLVNEGITIRCPDGIPARTTEECVKEYSTPVLRDRSAFELIHSMLDRGVPPGDVQAKLFQALAEIPGVQDDGVVEDAVGADAIAIAWNHKLDTRDPSGLADQADNRLQILLDLDTKGYRGFRVLDFGSVPEDEGHLRGSTIIVSAGIVDEPGQRP